MNFSSRRNLLYLATGRFCYLKDEWPAKYRKIPSIKRYFHSFHELIHSYALFSADAQRMPTHMMQ